MIQTSEITMSSRSLELKTVKRLFNIAMEHNLNKRYPNKSKCQLSSYPPAISPKEFWDFDVSSTLQSSCFEKYSTFVYLCLALEHSTNQQEDIKIFTLLRKEMPCVGGAQSVDA